MLAGARPGVRCCCGAAAVGMEVGAGLETWSRQGLISLMANRALTQRPASIRQCFFLGERTVMNGTGMGKRTFPGSVHTGMAHNFQEATWPHLAIPGQESEGQ